MLAATTDPREPAEVMADFVAFVLGRPGPGSSRPTRWPSTGSWIDFYLRRFTEHQLVEGIYESEPLFHDTLCLRSYAAAVTGRSVREVSPATLPSEWFGEVPHTHRAIDDALGYAHLLVELFKRAADAVGA